MEKEITFKTTLVFWKLYETNLKYTNEEMIQVLKNSKYQDQLYDGYFIKNLKGERIPLKWIATTGKFFVPNCFKLQKTDFNCINNSPNVKGEIRIDAHVYPEGVLLLQAKLDFNDYNTIGQLIIASIPNNIILTDSNNMGDKLDAYAEEIIDFLKTKIHRKKKSNAEKPKPWHHNWIWWDSKPKTPISDFDINGKHIKYALGMCTRSDKWKSLNPENYSTVIEDIFNLSPYEGNCVYISHPGNTIIPSSDFIDPNAIKNTIVDVLFAAEIGNVQRYLILNHLQEINFRSLEISELLYKYQEDNLNIKELIENLEDTEQEINEFVLEINKNLQITRTTRLIFTSVYKTKIMKQMVHVLHGDLFFDSLFKIIEEMKDCITRQRDITSMRVNAEENTFLRNLQIVFIIGLISEMISMFYMDMTIGLNWLTGLIFTIISVISSFLVLYFLKKIK